jgi:hypothetical protein
MVGSKGWGQSTFSVLVWLCLPTPQQTVPSFNRCRVAADSFRHPTGKIQNIFFLMAFAQPQFLLVPSVRWVLV